MRASFGAILPPLDQGVKFLFILFGKRNKSAGFASVPCRRVGTVLRFLQSPCNVGAPSLRVRSGQAPYVPGKGG